ncbi:MAG: serine protein kinase PrkA [Nanoarchaeota archaeon]|nr:serine protein kinase PrkA [Nanoarchaeota archaeon]
MATSHSKNALDKLNKKLDEKQQGALIPFSKFLETLRNDPYPVFRNIFHLFYDFVHYYLPKGVEEYPDDPETINFKDYDCTKLLVEGADHPFFVDRLFANKLVRLTDSLKRGVQQNKVYLFEGPHGSGKSTFLNNLLDKFEEYTNTPKGVAYEVIWKIDKKKLGWSPNKLENIIQDALQIDGCEKKDCPEPPKPGKPLTSNSEYLEVPCPSHDNPILLIPKHHRKEFLEDLIKDTKFKEELFNTKEYEWVFKKEPCTICTSLYQALLDKLSSPAEVFNMLFTRKYSFNKRLGEGISVFNAGDEQQRSDVVTNQAIQNQLAELFGDSNKVRYIYSRYAKTNNGIYALMDIKDSNVHRLKNLHGIISEGVHKVEDLEENVESLFLAVINPEDKEDLEKEKMKAFSDRLEYIRQPYVLDYKTEAEIYKSTFGKQIENHFLPRVLNNFAKVIIASRLNVRSDALVDWLGNTSQYNRYCDENKLLLKMSLYTGVIPQWLSEEHRKSFTANIRRKLILEEAEKEGFKGFSGRETLALFDEFYSAYAKKGQLVNMTNLMKFFNRDELRSKIPRSFIESLKNLYDYNIVQEMKESLYYYNEKKISTEIQNYLFAINFDVSEGTKVKCVYTGENLELTNDFFDTIEIRILGAHTGSSARKAFREYTQKEYTSKTLTQEIQIEGKKITETMLYKNLFGKYVYNLKENVLDPLIENLNFRNSIKDYGTKAFDTYDKKIKGDVEYLINNLTKKFGYTKEGASQVCVYIIDNHLAKKFS